jgi:putative oxidoreductase
MSTTTETMRPARSRPRPRVLSFARAVLDLLDRAAPLGDLALRLYVAGVFWKSGLSKLQSWDTTVLLFEYEYQVPLLPPLVAAALATISEVLFSALLALGLGGRAAAAALSAVNVVAVLSYPDLMEAGLQDHKVWGLMLLVLLLRGPGKLSPDHLVARRLRHP